jgi:hypothetical protein
MLDIPSKRSVNLHCTASIAQLFSMKAIKKFAHKS